MQRPHPGPAECIPISLARFIQVRSAALFHEQKDKQAWEIVEEAIDDWMRRHLPDEIPLPASLGYQWKQLFLPNGTVLRTIFKGKNYHCRVDDDQILYEGKKVSPSGFVSAVGGIRRNAWKSLWILRPESAGWQRADSLRAPRRPVRSRKATSPKPAAHSAEVVAPNRAASVNATPPCSSPAPDGNPVHAAAPVSHMPPPRKSLVCWPHKSRPRSGAALAQHSLIALLCEELRPFLRQLLGTAAAIAAPPPRAQPG